MFYHIVNTYVGASRDERERLARASGTWGQLRTRYPNTIVPVFEASYNRSSADAPLLDRRAVPFVKDVVDSALRAGVQGEDILILTNADSCLVPSTLEVITDALIVGGAPCCWSSRRDLDKVPRSWLTASEIMVRGTEHKGGDLFAMRVRWWCQASLPDFLIGYEGWDAVFGMLMDRAGGVALPPIVYHELHSQPYWHQFRLVAPGNLHNRRLARAWLVAEGLYERACRTWPGMREYK